MRTSSLQECAQLRGSLPTHLDQLRPQQDALLCCTDQLKREQVPFLLCPGSVSVPGVKRGTSYAVDFRFQVRAACTFPLCPTVRTGRLQYTRLSRTHVQAELQSSVCATLSARPPALTRLFAPHGRPSAGTWSTRCGRRPRPSGPCGAPMRPSPSTIR